MPGRTGPDYTMWYNEQSGTPHLIPMRAPYTSRDSPIPHCSPYEMQDTWYYDPQLCSVCDIVFELITGWDNEN